MNFFQRQHDVRRSSRRMVVLFVLAVVAIVVCVDLVATVAFRLPGQPAGTVVSTLAWVSGLVVVAIALASFVRTRSLRSGGGGAVAQQLGGVYVPENTDDPRLRRLRNVVEEMAIASGVSVPQIYVLPDEAGINAFAAGFSPADAAITVTHGALERLNRDELQGVIAHEFSHVVNGDMRLNIRLMGTLFGILVLAIVGRIMAQVRGRTPIPLIGIALLLLGYVGVFFGRMIKAGVSRQREYLADASAVQYTRQTAGLAGALKKIGGLSASSTLRSKRAEDVSHMLFGEGRRLSRLFATHPPLEKRIRTLEPTFDITQLEALSQQWARTPPVGMVEDQRLGIAPAAPLPPARARMPVAPADVVAAVGGTVTPASPAHRAASAIIDAIPRPLLDRARHPEQVLPLVFGLLLASDPATRANQLSVLTSRYGPALTEAAERDADEVARMHPVLRLPLGELAFPALRHRPRPAQDAVLACIHELARADGRIDVFEYCLSRLLHRELYEAVHRSSPWDGRRAPQEVTTRARATLLALLAGVGSADPARADAAYRAGLAQVAPGAPYPFRPPAAGAVALEELWPLLDGLAGPEKELLVSAMVTVIGHDGVMTVSEIELLRTVCAVLHCPLPPLAQTRPERVAPDPGARS